jgi:hypothetical protein
MVNKKPRRRGRPPLPRNRALTAVVTVRLQREEKERCERAARAVGLSLAGWIRQTLKAFFDRRAPVM